MQMAMCTEEKKCFQDSLGLALGMRRSPGKRAFRLHSPSLLAWNVDLMVRMKQPYYEQEEKKLLLKPAEQESQRSWAWRARWQALPTSVFLVSRRKSHLFSLGHCNIQVNTIPKGTHALA